MEYLEKLNGPQKRAVFHAEGPLLIVAGAGAGKTRTLTHRIFHLIKSGVAPQNILAVTFTNKAASEMRARVETLLKESGLQNMPFGIGEQPFVGTFHSLGVHILRNHGAPLGIKRHFVIHDKSASLSLIKEAFKICGYDPKEHDPKKIQNIISKNKGELVTVDGYLQTVENTFFAQMVAEVWRRYEQLLKKESALDFDDLLGKTVALLRDHPDVAEHYKSRWHYIHIDEYQDTNKSQYMISKLLVGKEHNICVVGDTDQNIYSWRGANIANILKFEKDYPSATIVFLEENYRSTATIIQAANEIIKKNTLRQEKNLFTKNAEGEKIALYKGFDENSEAFFVAEKSMELIGQGVRPEEIAVLYRANFQSRVIEEAFLGLNIPYQVLGTKFFERKEVKDVLSFLRAALNPESLSDIKRIINVPARGIGKVTIAKIFSGQKNSLPPATVKKVGAFYAVLEKIRAATETKTPKEVIKFIVQAAEFEKQFRKEGEAGEERLLNIKELVSLASRYDKLPKEEALEKFLEDAALASDQDAIDDKNKGGGVRLMTVHASKGLEFPYVFITGMEQGLFPHEHEGSFGGRSDGQLDREEEERRLFYVALTRAKKKLYLTLAHSRMIFGGREANEPSEFLDDIPPDLIEVVTLEEGEEKPFEEVIID